MTTEKMRKNIFGFALSLVMVISLAGCGLKKDREDAENTAAQFYDALKANDVDKAMTFCMHDAAVENLDMLKKMLQENLNIYGAIKSVTPLSGFDVSKNTQAGSGTTSTVKLAYHVEYVYGITNDSLVLTKKGEGAFEIINYLYKEEQSDFALQIKAAEKLAGDYLTAIKAYNFTEATNMCGYSAFTYTPQDQWSAGLVNMIGQLGAINDFKIDSTKTNYIINGDDVAGKGNYYTIYSTADFVNATVDNEILIFAPDYKSELKVISHNWN